MGRSMRRACAVYRSAQSSFTIQKLKGRGQPTIPRNKFLGIFDRLYPLASVRVAERLPLLHPLLVGVQRLRQIVREFDLSRFYVKLNRQRDPFSATQSFGFSVTPSQR